MITNNQNHITVKPPQMIPLSEKLAKGDKGETWRQNNVNYFLDRSVNKQLSSFKLKELYKAAQGYLNEFDYTHITNPIHAREAGKKFSAELRNYDIISPLIQMLMGEYSKRPFKPRVAALNNDIEDIKLEEKSKLIQQQLENLAISALNQVIDTGFQSQEPLPLNEIEKKVQSIPDIKSITGQLSIKYIVVEQELKRKFRELFYDMLVTGRSFSLKGVKFKNPFYENLIPYDVGYVCSKTTTFIEDGESAWARFRLDTSEIIDLFNQDLTKEDVKWLESLESRDSVNYRVTFDEDTQELLNIMHDRGHLNYLNSSQVEDGKHDVGYVTWKSKLKIGKVKGINIFGEEYEFEVDEEYIKAPNEKVEWRWVNQVWEGWVIDNKIYLGVLPVEYQRGKFDNPSKCKLLINGRTLFGRYYFSKSPVQKLQPYQKLYNTVHWKMEQSINKNKDKILLFPKQLIPEDDDMDMFDMMFHVDEDGIMFLDEIDNNNMAALNGVKVLDLSLREMINFYYGLLLQIRSEAEEVIGINRQRKGQAMASDLKGVNEQAEFRSAIISEEIFLEFEELIDRELQGLLDLSKYAWRDGKKEMYLDSDQREAMLNIEGQWYQEIEYGVTVGNGREQQEVLDMIKNQAQALIQNDGKISTVAKLLRKNNIDEIIHDLELEEEKVIMQAQQNNQAALEAEKAKENKEYQMHQDKINVELAKIEASLLVAEMKLFESSKQEGLTPKEIEDINIQREKLQVEREKIAASLKNKVVGEK